MILSRVAHPVTGERQYRLTCLDCRIAWLQDEHGGSPEDYV